MTAVKPRQSRKKLESDLKEKSKRIVAKAKTTKDQELEEAEKEMESVTKKPAPKRKPPTGFSKKEKLEETAGISSVPITTLSKDEQRSIQDEAYWRTHWKEIDELLQEDINALDLTMEERVKLAKKRKNKEGRPTKLNEVIIRKLKEAFEQDCTITEACRRAKISTVTYYEWKKKDPDFSYEMEFFEEYLKNISL